MFENNNLFSVNLVCTVVYEIKINSLNSYAQKAFFNPGLQQDQLGLSHGVGGLTHPGPSSNL